MYYRSLNRVILACLLLCYPFQITFAQGNNFSVSRTSPSWIVKKEYAINNPKPKTISDGFYLFLYEDQHHVELRENYTHVIRQIVSNTGVQNASQVSVTYDPSYEKLTFHKITVWRKNKAIDKLNASKFQVLQNEKDLSRFIYSGTYDAYIILDDIRKGDRIEYEYTLKGHNPIFGNKYSNDLYFENANSISNRYTLLITNTARLLKFKNFNFNTLPKTTEKGGLKLYEWESSNTETYPTQNFAPSWDNPFRHTQVSEYSSWSEVVDWGINTNSYPNLKTQLIDKKVRELQDKAQRDTTKYMLLATRFVQDEIRYMGVEMGEYSQRPNSPEKVIGQRYGDCKDKSLLLVYLLKKAGVKAYMAYVDTYAGKNTKEFLPSPTLFDHVVVVVEYHGNKIWIDPTIAYQRGSFDNTYFPNYGQALVLKAGVYRPEEVISIATGKLVAFLNFTVRDTAKSKQTMLNIISTYTDNYADDLRADIADQGEDGIEKSFLDYISNYYSGAEKYASIDIRDNEDTNTIEVKESYIINDIWDKEKGNNGRSFIYFYGDLISTKLRTITAKNRTTPIALRYPISVEENISIDLPFVANLNNESFTVETDKYYFELNTFLRGRNVKLNYVYRSMADYIERDEIKKYTADIEKINQTLSVPIIWNNVKENSALNPYAIVLTIVTFLATAFYFIGKYRQRLPPNFEEMTAAIPIGGWLWLSAIGLAIGPLVLIIAVAKTGLYDAITWNALTLQPPMFKYSLGLVYCLEIIGFAIRFNWLLLLIALFFKRRRELPTQYIAYAYLCIVMILFDFAAVCLVNYVTNKTLTTFAEIFKIGYTVGISFLWIVYLKRSERVRETFVFTYPEVEWQKELITTED